MIRVVFIFFIISLFLSSGLADAQTDSVKVVNQVALLIEEAKESPDWLYIGQTKHGYVGFMGKDRFFVNGPERRAWTKVFIRRGEQVKTVNGKAQTLIYRLTHRIYDCSLNRISDIRSVNYFADGTNESIDYAKFYKSYPEKRWTEIVPGSIGDVLLKFVCEYDPA